MGIIEAITAGFKAFTEFFSKLPMIAGWFKKPISEKVEKVEGKVTDLQDEFIRNGGRNAKK